jgi:glycosyltransferase involved in cell wall biosynthesis
LVGASVNIDIFRPRPPEEPDWLEHPLTVAAMIRSSTPYREPALTMEILRRASHAYPGRIQPVIFGTEMEDAAFGDLPLDFAWLSAGVLNRRQVAWLFNEVDVFVDFSSHQAMGLTALEAMACGAAVVVPEYGGATAFARQEENSLVVDTTSREASWEALRRLIEDDDLRQRLQRAAIRDVAMLFPERSAFRILEVLFGKRK